MRTARDVFMWSSSALEAPPKAAPMLLLAQPEVAADTTYTLPSAAAASTAMPATTTRHPAKKRVRWGTVTALEFNVGHNACCVPASAGPPVGLVGRPIRYTVSSVQLESLRERAMSSNASATSTTSKARREAFWLSPMERVRILHEEASLPLAAITEICTGVSAVLDARAVSKFDHVATHILETLELSRHEDLSQLRATFHRDNRKKIVLF